jgi:hypothetical protein
MYECSRTLGTLEFVCCKALANIFASFWENTIQKIYKTKV